MSAILASFSREFRAYFFSPIAYIVATLMLLVNGSVVLVDRELSQRSTGADRRSTRIVLRSDDLFFG